MQLSPSSSRDNSGSPLRSPNLAELFASPSLPINYHPQAEAYFPGKPRTHTLRPMWPEPAAHKTILPLPHVIYLLCLSIFISFFAMLGITYSTKFPTKQLCEETSLLPQFEKHGSTGDLRQRPETVWVVTARGGVLLASSGWRPGILPSTLQCPGEPP